MQRLRGLAGVATFVLASLVPIAGSVAQSPSTSSPPSPDASSAPCPTLTVTRFPYHEPGFVETQAFANQNPAFPNPDPTFAGRIHPGADWSYPGDPPNTPVFPIGNGRVVALDVVGTGDRGEIVVIEHAGPFVIPASTPGAPYSYPAIAADTVLTAYEGIDPSPALAVGDCVTSETQIGVTTARCGPGVAAPCSDLPAQLHFELRLASTADIAMHSVDWSVVGPIADSSGGYFLDPQTMVDDGLREPTPFIASLAAPCASASPAPDASVGPCPSPVGTPTASPTPSPFPTPGGPASPTPRPIHSPAADLLAGIPASVRGTCIARATELVTGTLAAVTCHPVSRLINLVAYFLVRPADARFVFASRMAQYGLKTGGDCHAGVAGIETKRADLSIGCYTDASGHAYLRFASSAACPGVYVGVDGTGTDIAALTAAYDRAVGGSWQDPGSDLPACHSGGKGVSAPPAPTHVKFRVHVPRQPTSQIPPYRLEVVWDESVTADTTIEVYAVTRCPARPIPGGQLCLSRTTPLPASIRKFVASAPADADTVSWTWPGWEILGGAVANDGHRDYWGIVVRAVNAHGASAFVIAADGNGTACSDCVY